MSEVEEKAPLFPYSWYEVIDCKYGENGFESKKAALIYLTAMIKLFPTLEFEVRFVIDKTNENKGYPWWDLTEEFKLAVMP